MTAAYRAAEGRKLGRRPTSCTTLLWTKIAKSTMSCGASLQVRECFPGAACNVNSVHNTPRRRVYDVQQLPSVH